MDKASIIIPYHRKKKFFKKTIKSILNQTYKNFEVIIIYDDNRKDELNFVKDIVKKDQRLRLIVNKTNLGAGESRNRGLKLAKGQYICFIDADDVWMKNKLKIQIDFMKKKKISCSHTSYVIVEKMKIKNFLIFSI